MTLKASELAKRARELEPLLREGRATVTVGNVADAGALLLEMAALLDRRATDEGESGTDNLTHEQAIATIIRDACESEPAPHDADGTICIDVDQLRLIVEHAFSQLAEPRSASPDGERVSVPRKNLCRLLELAKMTDEWVRKDHACRQCDGDLSDGSFVCAIHATEPLLNAAPTVSDASSATYHGTEVHNRIREENDRINAAMMASSATSEAAATPPREPTNEMMRAGYKEFGASMYSPTANRGWGESAIAIWKAMFDVAQQQRQPQGDS